ncbi:phenylacetate--CoA ligase family protein [Vibrio sp. MarTm2]|uniref:phenylacetate--CoA ligase family protein n=1 Tax=Vibrio sp. MarTm2 TaxID=2998831 RepID=UPI0022CD699F|nr:phenylacetate--CoA ligase family protein [Vibrio sp. MarTm2]MDA0130019.1 phenylacetate--CoA ligase family protein [Vibrio sp. MarTm2]
MYTNKIYVNLPVILQNIYVSVFSLVKKLLRDSKRARYLEEELKSHERNNAILENYSEGRLKSTLLNAVNNTSFYKAYGAELSQFPTIDKSVVKNGYDSLRNTRYRGFEINGETSGTTGTPLTIKQTKESVEFERAFANRQRRWAGFEKGDRRAWLRGDMIVPIKQSKAPFWRYSYFEDMILLSSYHMTRQALPMYIDAMVEYGVDVIQAYPSSVLTLARYLKENKTYYPGKVKSVLTSSESLSKEDKALIEERFKCTVFDWYGLFERVAAIASCEEGNYHILTDYSYVELLPAGKLEDGRKRAEIVGTNFNNSLYPLIRYKTGDHVILSEQNSCPCGRVYPVIDEIEGRVGDYLVAENGQKIHILNHIPKGVTGLLATQFVQNELNKVTILAIVNIEDFTEKQKARLINNAIEKLGNGMSISVKIVDSIPRTRNGKVRQAICNVKVRND